MIKSFIEWNSKAGSWPRSRRSRLLHVKEGRWIFESILRRYLSNLYSYDVLLHLCAWWIMKRIIWGEMKLSKISSVVAQDWRICLVGPGCSLKMFDASARPVWKKEFSSSVQIHFLKSVHRYSQLHVAHRHHRHWSSNCSLHIGQWL